MRKRKDVFRPMVCTGWGTSHHHAIISLPRTTSHAVVKTSGIIPGENMYRLPN
jgi:hypothetical protein